MIDTEQSGVGTVVMDAPPASPPDAEPVVTHEPAPLNSLAAAQVENILQSAEASPASPMTYEGIMEKYQQEKASLPERTAREHKSKALKGLLGTLDDTQLMDLAAKDKYVRNFVKEQTFANVDAKFREEQQLHPLKDSYEAALADLHHREARVAEFGKVQTEAIGKGISKDWHERSIRGLKRREYLDFIKTLQAKGQTDVLQDLAGSDAAIARLLAEQDKKQSITANSPVAQSTQTDSDPGRYRVMDTGHLLGESDGLSPAQAASEGTTDQTVPNSKNPSLASGPIPQPLGAGEMSSATNEKPKYGPIPLVSETSEKPKFGPIPMGPGDSFTQPGGEAIPLGPIVSGKPTFQSMTTMGASDLAGVDVDAVSSTAPVRDVPRSPLNEPRVSLDDEKKIRGPFMLGVEGGSIMADIVRSKVEAITDPKEKKRKRWAALIGLGIIGALLAGDGVLDKDSPHADTTTGDKSGLDMGVAPSVTVTPESSFQTTGTNDSMDGTFPISETRATLAETEVNPDIDELLHFEQVSLHITDKGSISQSWADQQGMTPQEYNQDYYSNYEVTTADVLNNWDELTQASEAIGGMPVTLPEYMRLTTEAEAGNVDAQNKLLELNKTILDQQLENQVFYDFAKPDDVGKFTDVMLAEYKNDPAGFEKFLKDYYAARSAQEGVAATDGASGEAITGGTEFRPPISDFTVNGANGQPVQVHVADDSMNANATGGDVTGGGGGDTNTATGTEVAGDGTGGPQVSPQSGQGGGLGDILRGLNPFRSKTPRA